MGAKEIVKIVTSTASDIAKDSDLVGLFVGKYSDGTTRSIPDAIKGETMSPKTKNKIIKRTKKKKKKNKFNLY